jgi:hypothetical protein
VDLYPKAFFIWQKVEMISKQCKLRLYLLLLDELGKVEENYPSMPAVSSAICFPELLLPGVLWDEVELSLSPETDACGWKRDINVVKSMQWTQLKITTQQIYIG